MFSVAYTIKNATCTVCAYKTFQHGSHAAVRRVCSNDFLPDVLFLTAFNPNTQPAKLHNLLLFVSRFTEISLQPSEASFSLTQKHTYKTFMTLTDSGSLRVAHEEKIKSIKSELLQT